MGYFSDTVQGVKDFCESEGQPAESLDRLVDAVESAIEDARDLQSRTGFTAARDIAAKLERALHVAPPEDDTTTTGSP